MHLGQGSFVLLKRGLEVVEGLVTLYEYGFQVRCLPSQRIAFERHRDRVPQTRKDGSYLFDFVITQVTQALDGWPWLLAHSQHT
jgi:hypothetical protein